MLLIIATTIVAFTGCGQLNGTGVIKRALNAKLIEEPVVLCVDGEAITVTGGMFTLEEVKKGPHTLRVEHPGFVKYEKNIYVSDMTTNKIKKYKQADGVFVADIGTAGGIAFNIVTQLVFGPDGNLYVADTLNGRIVVLSANLSVLRTFSVKDDGEANPWPTALAFGPDGCLYVHDRMNNYTKKIGPDDSIIQKIPTPSMFVNGLAFDDLGNLYVTDNSMNPLIHAYYWDRGIDR